MANVPSGIETLPKISIARIGCTKVTDRQSDDRRMDDDIIANVANDITGTVMMTRDRDNNGKCSFLAPRFLVNYGKKEKSLLSWLSV